MFVKYSKWPSNINNLRPSKLYPNWDFGFEFKPSGNPDLDRGQDPESDDLDIEDELEAVEVVAAVPRVVRDVGQQDVEQLRQEVVHLGSLL
jgi:hypothetical protein